MNIQFPENGLFIGLNSLKIENNKYEFSFKDAKTKERVNHIYYHPNFGVTSCKEKSSDRHIRNGVIKDVFNLSFKSKKNNKYFTLAIELVLTN